MPLYYLQNEEFKYSGYDGKSKNRLYFWIILR